MAIPAFSTTFFNRAYLAACPRSGIIMGIKQNIWRACDFPYAYSAQLPNLPQNVKFAIMALIRKAEMRDMEGVNRLLRQVLEIHHKGRPDLFNPSGKKYSDEELSGIFANPATPVFVCDDGAGGVLGYAFCEIRDTCGSGSLKPLKTLYIDDICVDEAGRGKGIGRALFNFVREFAAQQGCYNITLRVWECNPSAAAFYASLGMTPQYTSLELVL